MSYMKSTQEQRYLTAAEERELSNIIREAESAEGACSARLRQRAARARNELVEAHLRLAVSIANTYRNQGVELDDLIQAGNLGLIKAAGSYDVDAGFRFSTYARHWVKCLIRLEIANNSRTIRLPKDKHVLVQKVTTTETDLLSRLGRSPLPADVAAALGISVNEVNEAVCLVPSFVGLDAELSEGLTAGDLIACSDADAALRMAEFSDSFDDLLFYLSEIEQRCVSLRLGLIDAQERSWREVGEMMSTTPYFAQKHGESALAKLTHPCVAAKVSTLLAA